MNQVRKILDNIADSALFDPETYAFGTRDSVRRDWKILTSFSAVVAVIGIGFATLLFYRIQTGSILSDSDQNSSPDFSTINRQELSQVLDNIQQQQDRFEQIEESSTSIDEPASTERQVDQEETEAGEDEGQE